MEIPGDLHSGVTSGGAKAMYCVRATSLSPPPRSDIFPDTIFDRNGKKLASVGCYCFFGDYFFLKLETTKK